MNSDEVKPTNSEALLSSELRLKTRFSNWQVMYRLATKIDYKPRSEFRQWLVPSILRTISYLSDDDCDIFRNIEECQHKE